MKSLLDTEESLLENHCYWKYFFTVSEKEIAVRHKKITVREISVKGTLISLLDSRKSLLDTSESLLQNHCYWKYFFTVSEQEITVRQKKITVTKSLLQ